MGKSSSGKDTIYRELLNNDKILLHKIVMYTTRPKREGEVNGIQYHFVDEEMLSQLEQENRIIEVREYHTYHGIWKYFTVADKQINLESKHYLIIGTLESFIKTKEYYGADSVIPIFIDLDDGTRLQRALDRERAQENPKYEEMCRRFLADTNDFDDNNMKEAGITHTFQNDDLKSCLQNILIHMQKFI